ncbi:solute carrier family 35 member SLC35F1/F2/F6 [Melanogaster broomeanus]|nr:solute carrier family 35 member SLC35F1/F2/F6 [Melanogaster broomeanus]
MPSESSIQQTRPRPPIVFDSPKAFIESLYARFLSLWTPSFTYSLIGGQLLSLCITAASVTTTELVNRNWVMPSTQTFFTYLSLFVVYTPYTIYRCEPGLQMDSRAGVRVILRDGWKYFLLACGDVEGNFLSVKAYGYTDLLSCMLLDAWAIPVCLFSCWVYMRTKYHWTQIFGVLVCIGGLGLLVASDFLTGKDGHAESRGKGDAFMVAAATIYGVVNATEEFFVRHSPLYEVVGQLGMWGVLVGGIQASALEHELMRVAPWNSATIGILVAYTTAMFTLYSLAPLLYRTASSSYFNMALLTSDFYGLLFGTSRYSPYWLYFPAFAVVVSGLVIYFWHATPEEQGESNVQIPAYVTAQHVDEG